MGRKVAQNKTEKKGEGTENKGGSSSRDRSNVYIYI